MDIYFVTVGHKIELEVIRELKPKNILISYFYFRTREKIERLLNFIGYKPNILLDSGAYSAMTKSKDISLMAYMKFLDQCQDLIKNYIQLDVFEKEFITKSYYDIMKSEGYNPIPVFHYGFDESLLQHFIDNGEKIIALGGTVPIQNKKKVSEWLKMYCWLYPDIDFHLLGSFSMKILDHCDLGSVDASSWIMQAVMGSPKNVWGKKNKMIANMRELMQYEEESNL